MHRLSKFDETSDRGAGFDGALAKRVTSVAAARLASAADLMATGDQLSIPRLEGVPLEYLYSLESLRIKASGGSLVQRPDTVPPKRTGLGATVELEVRSWISPKASG